jgi:hypothetical protein
MQYTDLVLACGGVHPHAAFVDPLSLTLRSLIHRMVCCHLRNLGVDFAADIKQLPPRRRYLASNNREAKKATSAGSCTPQMSKMSFFFTPRRSLSQSVYLDYLSRSPRTSEREPNSFVDTRPFLRDFVR